MVEDTFRVTSLSLQSLQGAESIRRLHHEATRASRTSSVCTGDRPAYIKQESVKDAADAYAAFASASRCTRRRRCCRRA